MSRQEHYSNMAEEEPKDLSVKTAKKLKHIPPPLNLSSDEKVPVTMLKEFALIATSPKSPLMQKHLPFRKRAHSIAVNPTKSDSSVTIPSIVDENLPQTPTTPAESLSIPSSPSVIHPLLGMRDFRTNCTPSHFQPLQAYRSHYEPISSCGDLNPSFVLDLSMNASSVLLSPAPSSLGSSREELTDAAKLLPQTPSWPYPWPPPVWQCFQAGVRVRVAGGWRHADDMSPYSGEQLLVERVSFTQITCCTRPSGGEIVAELTPCHPLLVRDRGWVAICPDSFHKRYGLKCLPLQPGDVILHPAVPLPLTSPDICERIKRFSFPTLEESPPSPGSLLSPPTTPTRKCHEVTDKPKRPMNAFMLFAKRYRLELIQSNPGKDNRAISVILGEAWRTLPQEERDKFIQGARDLSEEQKLLYPDCWKRKRSHSTS